MSVVARFVLLLSCVLLLSSPALARGRKREQEEDFWFNFGEMETEFDKEFEEEEERKSKQQVNDPDMNKDPCEIIRARGFICQPHHPVTNDGYILTLFRIINPYSIQVKERRKRPLLLMHGLMGSSADFVIGSGFDSPRPPPSKGLPYIPHTNNLGFELSNHGYGESKSFQCFSYF